MWNQLKIPAKFNFEVNKVTYFANTLLAEKKKKCIGLSLKKNCQSA